MKSKYYIDSLAQYVQVVDAIVKVWTDEADEYIYPWFRGHTNHSHSLLPGIYRDPSLLKNEDSYRQDFTFKAHPFLDQSYYKPTNHFEWYFLMQHYGMPTRLLDWTEGSLIALHFAINNTKDEINRCVWVLNPFKFNKFFSNKDKIFTDEKRLDKYIPELWSNSTIPKVPVAIQPQINSKRIFSQKGCFMLFGSKQIDLTKEAHLAEFLVKIEIDNNQLELIRDSLTITGVTESIIFPELAALAKEIKHYYRS